MVAIGSKLSPLYDVRLIEDGRNHYYTIGNDEKWYPSSTTVLKCLDKPALIPWALNQMGDNIKDILSNREIKPWEEGEIDGIIKEAKGIYKKKSAEATDLGSRAHKAIDDIIKGNAPEITDDIRPAVDGFLKWKEEQHIEIIAGDTRIGSKLFGFGGSLDFVGLDGDQVVIFDNKTNKKRKDRDHGLYPEAAYQLSSYAVAFKETFGLPVKAVYGLWLDKEKGGFKAVKVSNINAAFEVFLACLKIYQNQKFEMFDDLLL